LSSESDLVTAFKDQDAVVSAVPNPRLSSERIWMDAAIAAGVKRIVPSEFSTNLETEASRKLPIIKDKLEIRAHVESLATTGKIEWTSVNNGPFLLNFIWTQGWMGPNLKRKIATYHDGGDKIVATSTLERIAEGVTKVLADEHVELTKNKPTYVYSTAMSERQMTKILAKAANLDPSDFQETDLSIKKITDDAYKAVSEGDKSKMMTFYIPFCFGDGYGGDFRDISWNERFGLKEMTEDEVEWLVKSWL
jgi:hypothetical protein